MSSSFKVQHIEEQPETAYDDTDMEDNDEQQPSTSNANEMANDIIKEAKNAQASQEEMTSTKKHQQKARGQPQLERKAHQPIHLAKERARHSLMKPQQ